MNDPDPFTDEDRQRWADADQLFLKGEQAMTVIDRVLAERARQDEKWGVQNYPWFGGDADESVAYYMDGWTEADQLKHLVDSAARDGDLDFAGILAEEFAEALEAPTADLQVEELIQVAAVAIAAIESIERNGR